MSGLVSWVGEALFGDGEQEQAKDGAKDTAAQQSEGSEGASAAEEETVSKDDMITEDQLRELMQLFKEVVESEAGKKRLRDVVEAGGEKTVEDETTEIQCEIISGMGLDPQKTLSMLRFVLTYYKDNQALCKEFIEFCEMESLACDEAELGPEKFREKMEAARKAKEEEQKRRMMDSVTLRQEVMMLKRRQALLKLSSDEQKAQIAESIEKMRTVMRANPAIKQTIMMQLKSRGMDVGDAADAEELLSALETEMKEVQDASRRDLEDEAKEQGITPQEVVDQKMKELTKRMEEAGLNGQFQGGKPCQHHGHGGGAQGPPMPWPNPGEKLRFSVGQSVQCNLGRGWAPGKIRQQWYSEPHWPEGKKAAYQVELDNGMLIFAPMDRDEIIRQG